MYVRRQHCLDLADNIYKKAGIITNLSSRRSPQPTDRRLSKTMVVAAATSHQIPSRSFLHTGDSDRRGRPGTVQIQAVGALPKRPTEPAWVHYRGCHLMQLQCFAFLVEG